MIGPKVRELVFSYYEMDEEDLAAALLEQEGKCAGCEVAGWNEPLSLVATDGVPRGAFCERCAPLAEVPPAVLQRASSLLEKSWPAVKEARALRWAGELRAGATVAEIAAGSSVSEAQVRDSLRDADTWRDAIMKLMKLRSEETE